MADRYTKAVLTVIAAALIWLCLWGPGPKWGTPAKAAQSKPVAVNIAAVGGKRVSSSRGVPVEGALVQQWPVDVRVRR